MDNMASDGGDQDNRAGLIIGVVVFLLVLTTVFFLARLYVRRFLTRSLGWDDWMGLVALFFTLGTGIDMCIMTKFGLGYHIDTLTPDQLTSYFIAFYLSIVMYNVGLGAIKISILLQYYRIFASRMRRVTVAAMAVVGAWSVALVLISIFTCHPIAAFWDKTIAGGTCIPSLPQWYINAAGNIATDLFIFALPIPVLWRLQLPRSQRLSLIAIFCLGFFTCTISVIRISFLNISSDTTYENVGPAGWSVGELACGIIGSALPTLRPVFFRLVPALAPQGSAGSKHYGRAHSGNSGSAGRSPEQTFGQKSLVSASGRHQHSSTAELTRAEDLELGAAGLGEKTAAATIVVSPPPAATASDDESSEEHVMGLSNARQDLPIQSPRSPHGRPDGNLGLRASTLTTIRAGRASGAGGSGIQVQRETMVHKTASSH